MTSKSAKKVKSSSNEDPSSTQDVFKESLISSVFEKGAIWNKFSSNYKDIQKKESSWREISSKLKKTVEECKKSWKNLSDTYRSKLRSIGLKKTGDDLETTLESDSKKQWKFFSQMNFMKAVVVPRKTSDNFNEDSDSSEELPDISEEVIFNLESQMNESNEAITTLNSSSPKKIQPRKRKDPIDILVKHLNSLSNDIKGDQAGPFEVYLGKLMKDIPPQKKRKCEQDILKIVNDYLDDVI